MCGGRACARHIRVARCQYCTCLVGYSCCYCASLSSLIPLPSPFGMADGRKAPAARAGAARAGRALYGSGHAFCPRPFTPPPPPAGHSGEALGDLPDPASLPPLPTFTPAGGPSSSGLDVLAVATADHLPQSGDPPNNAHGSLHSQGPYNPAASLPPKVVNKILAFEFVEMSELRGDIWPDDSTTDAATPARRTSKPPVVSIKSWLECYARMATVLVSRFPEKAPELWAYQSTVLVAAHNYEGANWVAYDRQFRRAMLAKKNLNWSVHDTRL